MEKAAFDYKAEFWRLFKEYATFLTGNKAFINSLPREDIVKALEELLPEYSVSVAKRKKEGLTGGASMRLVADDFALYRIRDLLAQAKRGVKILTPIW